MLYRLNSLLVAEELRNQIAREANIGLIDLPASVHWPSLDFGWSRIVAKAAKDLEDKKNGIIVASEDDAPEARKNPGYNLAGRPSKDSILADRKPTGQVKISSFTVDSFDPVLDNFKLAPTVAKSIAPIASSAATTSKQPVGTAKSFFESDDPFSTMGDWTSFAEKVSVEQVSTCCFVCVELLDYNTYNASSTLCAFPATFRHICRNGTTIIRI